MAPHSENGTSPQQSVQTWFVAFTSYRGRNPLYRRFLPCGFGHVFAFARLHGGVLLLDPQEGGVLVNYLPPPVGKTHGPNLSAFITSLRQHLPDLTLLEVPSSLPARVKHPAMFLPSCVNAIKAVLCRQCWALTPKGLFKSLQREGAQLLDDTYLEHLVAADIAAMNHLSA